MLPTLCPNLDLGCIVFIISTQVQPEVITTQLLNSQRPVVYDTDHIEPQVFLWRLAHAITNHNLEEIIEITTIVTKNQWHDPHVPSSNGMLWTFDLNTNSSNEEQRGFSMFEFSDESSWGYHCDKCGHHVNTNKVLLRQAQFRFNHVPIEEFVLPKNGSKWSSEDIALRTGEDPITFRCSNCQTPGFFVWDQVPKFPGPKYPLLIIVKRYMPEVDSVQFGKGNLKSQLPNTISFGGAVYYYSGWTAKLGHIRKFCLRIFTHRQQWSLILGLITVEY